ncbi:MAG: SIR2 family protein [Byssovorax sp.]
MLTTNLDGLLERAFAGRWTPMARATGDIAQRRRYILKLHGTLLDRATWVLTRAQYDRAMYADPQFQGAFSALFNACPILFVGCDLADDDLDLVLGRVRALAGSAPPRHFALVAADTVSQYRRSRLEKGGIRLIAYDNPDGQHAAVIAVLRDLAARP